MPDDEAGGRPEQIKDIVPFTPETASKVLVDAWCLASRLYPRSHGQHLDEERRWRDHEFDPEDCFYAIAEMSPDLFEFYRRTYVTAVRYYGGDKAAKEEEERCERQSRLVPGLDIK